MERGSYSVSITVNGQKIKKVVIDSHYKLKHSSTMSEELKRYRLVWLIEKEELFIGVINAYRR